VKKSLLIVAVALVAIAAVAVPAMASNSPVATAAKAKTINVGDFYFVKKGATNPSVTVKPKTKVTFKFVGPSGHNVSASGPKKFKSKVITKGTYSQTLTKKGTYKIICTLHPWMTMKLKVK
jgi:plastocyanin